MGITDLYRVGPFLFNTTGSGGLGAYIYGLCPLQPYLYTYTSDLIDILFRNMLGQPRLHVWQSRVENDSVASHHRVGNVISLNFR